MEISYLDSQLNASYDLTSKLEASMDEAQLGTTTAKEALERLSAQYGPVMGGVQLRQALGFSSAAAMRQAALRGQVGVRLFSLQNRRGKFALTLEVATWLAGCMRLDEPSVASTTQAPAAALVSHTEHSQGERLDQIRS